MALPNFVTERHQAYLVFPSASRQTAGPHLEVTAKRGQKNPLPQEGIFREVIPLVGLIASKIADGDILLTGLTELVKILVKILVSFCSLFVNSQFLSISLNFFQSLSISFNFSQFLTIPLNFPQFLS